MYNVFISYLREDKEQVLRLAGELRSRGAGVFVDVSDLSIGAPWREEIAEAIRRAEFFLACFSSRYEERPVNGMVTELKYVISLRKEGGQYPEILPVKLNATRIPDIPIDEHRNLSDLHWFLLDDQNWGAGVEKLAEITLKMAKERARNSLRAKAEEVAVKKARVVKAREEFNAHQRREIRRQLFRANSPERSSYERFEPPAVWPAQEYAKRETELEYAWSEYGRAQVEYVQKFGEEYHPLPEFLDRAAEEEKRIHKSFEDAEKAEDRAITEAIYGFVIMVLLVFLLAVVISFVWGWLRRLLGF
jgi:hypothetical protein